MTQEVAERLREEFRLIERHNLAGFLLLYREIVLLAQEIMEERGLSHPETPLEERPPGRGRGSSVALLVGYLTGISHVDPLRWGLTLERFISEDTSLLPDIDLDFPRQLRDELIRRVHQRFGPEFAVLTRAVSTYSVKGIIQDLGKALGLPREELSLLSKQLHSRDAAALESEMRELPAFRQRAGAPGWHDLLELAPQLMHAPRSLGQHVGGLVLISSPIPELAPTRAGAMEGRYVMDWNKDSVADAGFAKIDLLSLPVLDQLEETLDLIEEREGRRPDISRIAPEDMEVYGLISEVKVKGVFLLQSPAQLKMGQRLKSRNLLELAYQVALIRPGVGVQGSAVSQFVERYRHGAPWDYNHPLERRALERGGGVIVWQEQVVHLVMDVAGFTAAQADELRRAFARPHNALLPEGHWRRFAVPGRGAAQRRAGGCRPPRLRQAQRAVYVPRIPLPRLRGHRLSSCLAEALSPGGVLRLAGQQPAHGLLPGGDAEAGRPAFRRAVPQPLRQPQPGALQAGGRRGAAGAALHPRRGRGVGQADCGRAAARRLLRRGRRPGDGPVVLPHLTRAIDELAENHRLHPGNILESAWADAMVRDHPNLRRAIMESAGTGAWYLENRKQAKRLT